MGKLPPGNTVPYRVDTVCCNWSGCVWTDCLSSPYRQTNGCLTSSNRTSGHIQVQWPWKPKLCGITYCCCVCPHAFYTCTYLHFLKNRRYITKYCESSKKHEPQNINEVRRLTGNVCEVPSNQPPKISSPLPLHLFLVLPDPRGCCQIWGFLQSSAEGRGSGHRHRWSADQTPSSKSHWTQCSSRSRWDQKVWLEAQEKRISKHRFWT